MGDALSLEFLEAFLCRKLGVSGLRDFQLAHSFDLCRGRDLVLVVAAGGGKAFVIAAAPLVAQYFEQIGIGFIIVPSKVLTEQYVSARHSRIYSFIHTLLHRPKH